MKNKSLVEIYKLVLSALFLALALVLPLLTANNPSLGNMFCLMHIPVILCGYICGWKYSAIIGFTSPILRFILFGMPPIYPTAIAMSFELATYGLAIGIFHSIMPKKKGFIYLTLFISMLIGKTIWGVVMFSLMGFNINNFGIGMFFTQAIFNALPGLILQFVLIPVAIIFYEHFKKDV